MVRFEITKHVLVGNFRENIGLQTTNNRYCSEVCNELTEVFHSNYYTCSRTSHHKLASVLTQYIIYHCLVNHPVFVIVSIIGRKEFIDLRIGDDMKRIDYVRELKIAIDSSDLKKHINETFHETDFTVKEFRTENYPKNSQAYLIEAEFYCRKAREYRAKELTAAIEVEHYEDLEKMYSTDKESRDIKEQSKKVSLFLEVCLFIKILSAFSIMFKFVYDKTCIL